MSAQKNSNMRPGHARKAYSNKHAVSKGKNLKNVNPHRNIYLALPLFLIIALVPLIIYVKKIIVGDPGNLYWDGQGTHYDIFSYYKMIYLLFFTGAGLLFYLFMRMDNPFEKARKPYYIPLGIFALLVLISAIASDYRQVAFWGFLDRYEGALVLIAYCMILFLATNVLQDERILKLLFGCLLASAAIILILGVFQYFGMNFMNSDITEQLITPPKLLKQGGSIKLNLGNNTVFSTLYNPNYVGSYLAMLLPVLIILLAQAKKLWVKAAIIFIMLLAVIDLVGCGSRAGFIGIAFSVLILLIIFRRSLIAHKWIALSTVALLIAGLAILNLATHGSVISRLQRLATLETNVSATDSQKKLDDALTGLSDIRMDDYSLQLVTDKGSFVFNAKDGKLQVKDGSNKVIPIKVENNNMSFNDERFKNIKFVTKPEESLIQFYYNKYHLMDVVLTREGLRSPTNRWLTYRGSRNVSAFGFKGMETYGSNRGYIWSRTIPLLKDTILIGKGPDTFALYFPQFDLLDKLRYYHSGGIFVDKAHNMYLQTALNTGVLSLLALLVLFGVYFISSVKIYFKGNAAGAGFMFSAGAACFTAFCGYSAAALFNDSVVSVAPVFWILLGAGIGINLKLAGYRRKAVN